MFERKKSKYLQVFDHNKLPHRFECNLREKQPYHVMHPRRIVHSMSNKFYTEFANRRISIHLPEHRPVCVQLISDMMKSINQIGSCHPCFCAVVLGSVFFFGCCCCSHGFAHAYNSETTHRIHLKCSGECVCVYHVRVN